MTKHHLRLIEKMTEEHTQMMLRMFSKKITSKRKQKMLLDHYFSTMRLLMRGK